MILFKNYQNLNCVVLAVAGKCARHDDGRGTGVRDPADHHGKAAFRPGELDKIRKK